jgi:enoyl-CoA hydratase/carnithine racemase
MTSSQWPAAPIKGPEGVGVAREGGVLTLTLYRPTDQNRLTRDVLVSLQSVADRLRDDSEIHAVVVTGSGSEFFSMGILNPAVRSTYTKEQILELVRTANRLYDAIEALPQIVIVALNGIARAGAVRLARGAVGRIPGRRRSRAAAGDRRPGARAGADLHGPRDRRRRDGAAGAGAVRSSG